MDNLYIQYFLQQILKEIKELRKEVAQLNGVEYDDRKTISEQCEEFNYTIGGLWGYEISGDKVIFYREGQELCRMNKDLFRGER